MAGSRPVRDRYFRWNGAIADVVFSRESAGKPVYLDLEDDVLIAIRDAAEPEAPDPASGLVDAVRDTLSLRHGPSRVFDGHLRWLRLWDQGTAFEPPPTLGLLAVLSLAAETMHDGEGMQAHNFYGRLADLLDLDVQMLNRVQNAYRRSIDGSPVSAWLWDSLNNWLEMLEGNRGLPTAFALGHEHIGLPLSQALVRRTDREHFGDLFALHSLPPRSSLPAFDMERLIEEWITRQPCPVSNTLQRLWESGGEARSRITDVAVVTLESWDGPSAGQHSSGRNLDTVDLVRASAVVRSFPSRQLDVGLVVLGQATDTLESAEVLDADRSVIGSLELAPAASGYLSLVGDTIDTASFLGGDVLLRRVGKSRLLRRRPRRIVPMRYDDLLLAWMECERVQLGEESLILVRDELIPAAVELLNVVARPGFVVDDQLAGLPAGWTLVSGIQVLASIPVEMRDRIRVELNVLQPITSTQFVLQGGLRLPGNIAKWSSLLPPELRATAETAAGLSASLRCIRALGLPKPEIRKAEATGTVLIWDLSREFLVDGDYEIRIERAGESVRVMTLRLRSSDNPAILVDDELPHIGHDPGSRLFGLSGCRVSSESAVRGARDLGIELESGKPPSVPGWRVARQDRRAPRVAVSRLCFPAPTSDSCAVTGDHYLNVETAWYGDRTVEGVCRGCGLVKRYPAFRAKKKLKPTEAKVSSRPGMRMASLVPIRATVGIDWNAALDAVCHVGAGPASAIHRIADQMDGTSLFGDAFERRLEQLAYIEIERTSGSLAATSWEVVDPLVVGLCDGSAVITGFRSVSLLAAVVEHVRSCGGDVSSESVDAPNVIRISGLTEGEFERLAAHMGDASGRQAHYVPCAAEQLSAILPPLSLARLDLPTTTLTAARNYEVWNTTSARFEQASNASHVGAFRLTGFTRTYVYRSAGDVLGMRATLGDARIVKYLASADARRPLVGYDAASRVLYVPLGADLPGIYGRAAVLASGLPPTENIAERILEYRDVPPHIAAHLSDLLMS